MSLDRTKRILSGPLLTAGLVLGALVLNFVWASQLGASGLFGEYRTSAAGFILRGDIPYSQATPHTGSLPGTLRFYPLYALLFLGPFALIPSATLGRMLWMLLLEACIAGSAWLGMELVGWKPRLCVRAAVVLVAVFSYSSLRAVGMGSLVPLAGFFLVASLWFVKNQNDEVAGVLLAGSLIAPTVVAPAVLSVVIWALSHHRGAIVVWLLGALALMAGFAAVFLLNWPVLYWGTLVNAIGAKPPPVVATLEQVFVSWFPGVGARLALSIVAVVGVFCLTEWLLVTRGSFMQLTWNVALVLVAMQWMMVPTDAGNAVVFLLPCLLFLYLLEARWRRLGQWTGWGVLGILWLASWIAGLEGGIFAPSKSFLLVFVPGVLLVGLYWVRWWAVREKESWDRPLPLG